MESEMGTMFILDLLRQKREKLMRLKKDEMINEAARKQREKMQQVRLNKGKDLLILESRSVFAVNLNLMAYCIQIFLQDFLARNVLKDFIQNHIVR